MVRVSPSTTSFASGELSTLMFGRRDYARFQNGLRKCRGFMVLPEGPVTRLPGTQFLGRTHLNLPARLMRFAFKDEDAVLLEWTDALLRFWRQGQLVTKAGAPYTLASPYTLNQAKRLQSLLSSDRIYLTEGELPPQRVSRFAIDNWAIEPTPFENGPFSPRNTDQAKELAASGISGTVNLTSNFDFFQAGHVGVVFELSEVDTSATPAWSSDVPASVNDQFYHAGNVYRISAFDGSGSTTGVNPPVHTEGKWLAEKNGPVFEFLSSGAGIVQVTSVVNPRLATGTVVRRLPDGLSGVGTYRWSEGAWSAIKGFPRAIGAYRQRHIYGGTPSEPRTLWHSVIGGTVDMSAEGGDDEGFSYILDSDARENGEITYIVGAGGVLHVGTSAGEFIGSSTDADRAYAEETAKYDSDTDFGSSDIAPAVVKGKVVFLDKTARRMLTLLVNQEGRFDGEPLTQVARHILAPGATRIVYQAEPLPVIWAVLEDGDLVGCTYILKSQVLGFHRHPLAGGKVIDAEVMPSDDGRSEVLELVVERQIDGIAQHFRERLAAPFVDLDGVEAKLEDAWHLYAAVRYQGAATATITGLDHLEGQTIVAWTENGAYTDLVVSGGAVTLPVAVASAICGLDGSAEEMFETLDVRVGMPDGGDEGRKKAHRASGIHVHRTAGGTMSNVQVQKGVEDASLPVPILEATFADRVVLRDGVFDLPGHKGWADQSYLRFRPEPGAPFTMLALTPTMMVSDD